MVDRTKYIDGIPVALKDLAGDDSKFGVEVVLVGGGGDDRVILVNSDNELMVAANQDTHDDCNLNANIQVGDADVDNSNPVPVSDAGGSLTVDGTVAVSVTPVVTNATGTGAISVTYAPGTAFWLHSVTCRLSAAPTTSEDFTITLDASDGVTYDVLLDSVDPSTISNGNHIAWAPDGGTYLCEAGDSIGVAFAGSDGLTYGLRIVTQLA